MSLHAKAAISGIGEAAYSRDPGLGRTGLDLQLEASLKAVANAGLAPTDIDGIVVPIGIGPMVAENYITNFALPDLTADLAEGVRMIARLHEPANTPLRIGLPLRIAYDRINDDVTLPMLMCD